MGLVDDRARLLRAEGAAHDALREIDASEYGNEDHHMSYDRVICTFLESIGCVELARRYREHDGVTWWYA